MGLWGGGGGSMVGCEKRGVGRMGCGKGGAAGWAVGREGVVAFRA